MKQKTPTSMRLSSEAKRLLAKLSDKFSISLTATMEVIIRDRAKEENIRD